MGDILDQFKDNFEIGLGTGDTLVDYYSFKLLLAVINYLSGQKENRRLIFIKIRQYVAHKF